MDPLAAALADKIEEQIERAVHLVGFVSDPEWRPPIPGAWSFAELLGHLLDCLAGFCAVLYGAYPERLSHFAELRHLPVNYACRPADMRVRAETYRAHLKEGFMALCDADLSRKVPTAFVPEGETVFTLMLGNLEHLINHKYQLFVYLKLALVDVKTIDLYRFRG